jgi:hypothetical protein
MPLSDRPTKVKGHPFKEPFRLLKSTSELAEVRDKKKVVTLASLRASHR